MNNNNALAKVPKVSIRYFPTLVIFVYRKLFCIFQRSWNMQTLCFSRIYIRYWYIQFWNSTLLNNQTHLLSFIIKSRYFYSLTSHSEVIYWRALCNSFLFHFGIHCPLILKTFRSNTLFQPQILTYRYFLILPLFRVP